MNDISLLYFFSGILGAALIVLIMSKKPSGYRIPFVMLIMASAYYAITCGIELSFSDPDLILSIIRFEYLGIALIPTLWLIFVLSYTGRIKQFIFVPILILFIIPAIVIITALSGYIIPLLYHAVDFVSYKDLVLLSITPGFVYFLNSSYQITAFAAGVFILLDFSRHTHGIIRKQARIITLSGLIIIFTIVAYFAWIGPVYHIDITPLAYLFALLMGFLAIFQYRLFSLIPITYENIFHEIPSGLIIIDSCGYVIEANRSADTILNCDIREKTGEKLTEYYSDCPEMDEFIDRILKGEITGQESEFSCKRDNRPFFFQTRVTRIKDRHGSTEGFIILINDVTESRLTDKSLSEANKKLKLLSSITRHDILNQLTVLKGFQELSGEYITDSKISDPVILKYLDKESAAAENIYQHILFTGDYQDIGVNSPVWQNVGEKFKGSVKKLSPEDVIINIDTKDVEIYADPLLEKVFYNLIENSISYGEDLTEINLSYRLTDDDSLVILYKDNGGGIPDKEKENIFIRKFFKKSGLGMFLSREILSITNITINETGIYGEGVNFEIAVPNGIYRFQKT